MLLSSLKCSCFSFIFCCSIGAVLCFLANELLWQQTNSNEGIVNSAVSRVEDANNFIDDSLDVSLFRLLSEGILQTFSVGGSVAGQCYPGSDNSQCLQLPVLRPPLDNYVVICCYSIGNQSCITNNLNISSKPALVMFVMFTIISAIDRTNFYLASIIIGRISLFLHVIYSFEGLNCRNESKRTSAVIAPMVLV